MALASLIIGIVAAVASASIILAVVSWIPAIVGLILGFKAKGNIAASGGMKSGAGMATTGIVLSVIALVLAVLVIVLAVIDMM
ncbi:MAG: DUF4190 domain-containing protein [Streptosporangiales bacterium]|nr:DUF4190 domain-containing protein [Streptosporangiales bacterium]